MAEAVRAQSRDTGGLPKEWSRRTKVRVLVGAALSPVMILALLVVAGVFLFLVFLALAFVGEFVVRPIDQHFNSHEFAPGTWETRSGEHWITMRVDGTGDFRMPPDELFGDPTCANPDGSETGTFAWTFEPVGDGSTMGTLLWEQGPDDIQNGSCRLPYLHEEDSLRHYDWHELSVSTGDPDYIDVNLRKVLPAE